MRATFQYTCDHRAATVRIAGDLDLESGDELEDLLASLRSIGCTHLELDLSAITFIDYAVLELLRRQQRRLRMSGGDLRVVAASRWFAQACEYAEVDMLLSESERPWR